MSSRVSQIIQVARWMTTPFLRGKWLEGKSTVRLFGIEFCMLSPYFSHPEVGCRFLNFSRLCVISFWGAWRQWKSCFRFFVFRFWCLCTKFRQKIDSTLDDFTSGAGLPNCLSESANYVRMCAVYGQRKESGTTAASELFHSYIISVWSFVPNASNAV